MKRIPILTVLIAAIFAASCSKSTPEITNSIPDDAFLVASFHPQNLYEKGQVSTLESISSKIDNEFMRGIMDDPLKSGIDLGEYAFLFGSFNGDNPQIGITAVLKDAGKFNSMIEELIKDEDDKVLQVD
ncbi:MAG: DUF4836 family protein, partial [Bacteroidales bacterium]|nr:DUF4836 family protein [Bacteroidales bacterium]